MKRIAVISSTLISAGYDDSSAVLELEFTTHKVYQYFKVPVLVYKRLMAAPSKGTFFNAFIKEEYNYRKIRG